MGTCKKCGGFGLLEDIDTGDLFDCPSCSKSSKKTNPSGDIFSRTREALKPQYRKKVVKWFTEEGASVFDISADRPHRKGDFFSKHRDQLISVSSEIVQAILVEAGVIQSESVYTDILVDIILGLSPEEISRKHSSTSPPIPKSRILIIGNLEGVYDFSDDYIVSEFSSKEVDMIFKQFMAGGVPIRMSEQSDIPIRLIHAALRRAIAENCDLYEQIGSSKVTKFKD
jgi:hypothetical protein